MISDLFILIGLAFFIKLFFDGAKKIIIGEDGDVIKTRNFMIHGGLGIVFVLGAKLITLLF